MRLNDKEKFRERERDCARNRESRARERESKRKREREAERESCHTSLVVMLYRQSDSQIVKISTTEPDLSYK